MKAYLTMLSYVVVCGWPPSSFLTYSRVTWLCYACLHWCGARCSWRFFSSVSDWPYQIAGKRILFQINCSV